MADLRALLSLKAAVDAQARGLVLLAPACASLISSNPLKRAAIASPW